MHQDVILFVQTRKEKEKEVSSRYADTRTNVRSDQTVSDAQAEYVERRYTSPVMHDDHASVVDTPNATHTSR